MDSGIYQIVNVTNGKVYIGSSKALKSRRYTHFRDLRRGSHVNPHLLHAWDQCGESAFHFAVLEYCALEDLLEREAWWMDLLGSRDRSKGYNLWDARRHECSPETRAKLFGRPVWNRGKKMGSDWAWNKGKATPEDVVAKQSAVKMGKKASAETKAKMVASQAARRQRESLSPEIMARQSALRTGERNPFYGRTHTPEALARMKATQFQPRGGRPE